jgi:predicted RNA-binding protein with PIN domain
MASEVEEARRVIAAALDDAGGAVDALVSGLGVIARAAGVVMPARGAPQGSSAPAAPVAPHKQGPQTRVARRAALPLPPAVFDDSPEAAEHLVRVPGMLVLVDGYNVTLSAWASLPIAEQRRRLIDACTELAARTSVEILVVFDGAEGAVDLPARPGRRRVRWAFSPPDIEADDVLLGLVGDLEPGRPVTVASSDRRVLDGVRRLGANAISTAQLLATLRRESPLRAR